MAGCSLASFCAILLATVRPVGIYLARVLEGERTWLDSGAAPLRTADLQALRRERQRGDELARNTRLHCLASRLSAWSSPTASSGCRPFCLGTRKGLPAWDRISAWNTAASFTTNTNWQSYTPEDHDELSHPDGGAGVPQLLLRGGRHRGGCGADSRHQADDSRRTIGNFWVDTTRTLLYILLPACLLYALVLVWQGVPQNLHPYTLPRRLNRLRPDSPAPTQTIAQGPVASQEAIKMLGTNGGGFFNANSAHPYENPTPLSNFLQMLSIFIIPAGLTYTLGRMTGSPGHGWAVLAAMFVLFAAGFTTVYWAESHPYPLMHGAAQTGSATAPAGNMEGKEVRFGVSQSSLFATVTTDASCGAVNNVHDSLTPLGGMVVLTNIMLGEVVFGGVGAGMYGILIFVVLAVFIAGLMVGRTPEYLGKKIESYDVKMSMLYVLIFPLIILTLTAIFVLSPNIGLSALTNTGPHGLTEILYAFTSAVGNNGSAFAGLTECESDDAGGTTSRLGFAMLGGRFLMMIPVLALAGNLAMKKSVPPSPGTFPVNTPLFTVLLTGVILILGALTFFPALSLGPILEHFCSRADRCFEFPQGLKPTFLFAAVRHD